jgi:eukaryotic-like serine/threonine-protein kinase
MNHGPQPTTLTGRHVRLEPLAPAHAPDLFAALMVDPSDWSLRRVVPPTSLEGVHAGIVAFTQIDLAGGHAVGEQGVPDEVHNLSSDRPLSWPGVSAMQITLTVTAGVHKGRVFTFGGHDTFLIGRSIKAHLQLPGNDRFCSRMHCMLEVNPPYCRLMDMGSHNGTFVNGQRVTTVELKHGDKIRAGRTILRVLLRDIVPVAEPPVATEAPPLLELTQPPAAPPPVPVPTGAPACRICFTAIGGQSLWLCADCHDQASHFPQPIPGYTLIRMLGRGAMGNVSLAVRNADGLPVALKTVKPAGSSSRGSVERFLREVTILRDLHHPHIVAFRDSGAAGDQLFFAMDFIRGRNATQILVAEGPLAIDRAVRLVCQLLEALEYSHGRGFVHRDVKPSNLLVANPVSGDEVVKVADFGLARIYHESHLSGLTMLGEIGGTPLFMPPEQITDFRKAKPPADQYSAAATLYNLLTGEYVFDRQASIHKQFELILSSKAVPIQSRRGDVPGRLAKVIHKALAREPVARFKDVKAFREALAPHRK